MIRRRRLKQETGNALPVSGQQSRGSPAATEYNTLRSLSCGEFKEIAAEVLSVERD